LSAHTGRSRRTVAQGKGGMDFSRLLGRRAVAPQPAETRCFITRRDGTWIAFFKDAPTDRVVGQVGYRPTIELPYRAEAPLPLILAELQRLNPGVIFEAL
jgi:hypothetical protein